MKYQDLIDDISGTVSDYKKAALASPEFARQYPDLIRQIRKNEILAERGMVTQKRTPMVIDIDGVNAGPMTR